MIKDLRKIPQLRPEYKDSEYIGTEKAFKALGSIYAQVSPASDNYSIAAYGEKISKLYNVTADNLTDVRNGDVLIIDNEKCTVISVMKYSSHTAISAERTGIYEN